MDQVSYEWNPPVSFASPTTTELDCNFELQRYLQSNNIYDSQNGENIRKQIIALLHKLVCDWVAELGERRCLPKDEYLSGGGTQIYIFGSQRLNVHTPDSDIDILCVTPTFVSRDDFFSSFCSRLALVEGLVNLNVLPEAYTPVIKFKLNNIHVDMIFAALPLSANRECMDLMNNNILNNLDEKSIRSLNGCRVAEMILKLVPDVDIFCTALRAIKHWARQRGLYSNVLGFLGGVNFAILIAFICQKYVNACASTIVIKFFLTFRYWKWPDPVFIAPLEECRTNNMNMKSSVPLIPWSAQANPKDRMPIITPAYPAMNSAYNVGLSQLRMIQEEICRGHQICQKYSDSLPGHSIELWSELFSSSKTEYFTKYPRYIQLDFLCPASSVDGHRWLGWCESKLKLLSIALEHDCMSCHPQTHYFRRFKTSPSSPTERSSSSSPRHTEDIEKTNMDSLLMNEFRVLSYFIGLTFKQGLRTLDATPCVQDFLSHITSWDSYQNDMDIEMYALTKDTLPTFVFEERQRATDDGDCDEVCSTRSCELGEFSDDDYVVGRVGAGAGGGAVVPQFDTEGRGMSPESQSTTENDVYLHDVIEKKRRLNVCSESSDELQSRGEKVARKEGDAVCDLTCESSGSPDIQSNALEANYASRRPNKPVVHDVVDLTAEDEDED